MRPNPPSLSTSLSGGRVSSAGDCDVSAGCWSASPHGRGNPYQQLEFNAYYEYDPPAPPTATGVLIDVRKFWQFVTLVCITKVALWLPPVVIAYRYGFGGSTTHKHARTHYREHHMIQRNTPQLAKQHTQANGERDKRANKQ